MSETWILGATGRGGRAIAAELAGKQESLVLVGRDPARLRELAESVGGKPQIMVAGSVEAVTAELAHGTPSVVVNTIGPFTGTALRVARACPSGTHYVDLANELDAVSALLSSHDEAAAAGRCLVTGAGFGVLATESVVLKLCDGRPAAARVRVDALPVVDQLGPAVLASVIDSLAAGGRRYERGKLVRARLGGDFERLMLPDGSSAGTVGVPAGELEAARRASGAPFVVAASSEVPSARVIRAILPAVALLLSRPAMREAAKRQVARLGVVPPGRRGETSWAHARVQWPDGEAREGWLRMGEGYAFTARVAAEVVLRLAAGEGRPGAYTPGSLFGPEIAERAGGQFILDAGLRAA